jgi:hypothetical protein
METNVEIMKYVIYTFVYTQCVFVSGQHNAVPMSNTKVELIVTYDTPVWQNTVLQYEKKCSVYKFRLNYMRSSGQ